MKTQMYRNYIGTGLICLAAAFSPCFGQEKAPEAQNHPAVSQSGDERARETEEPIPRATRQEQIAAELSIAAQAHANQLRSRYAGELHKAEGIRTELQKETGRTDVSPQGLHKAIAWLEAQRESLRLEQAGGDARLQALADAVARATVKSESAAKDDPAMAELQKLVQAQTNALARVQQMFKNGVAGAAEVDKANAAVAEAKVQVAQRQRELLNAHGGDAVTTWNHELLDASIAQHERAARLAYVEARLNELRSSLGLIDEYQEVLASVRAAQQKMIEGRWVFDIIGTHPAGHWEYVTHPSGDQSDSPSPARQPASK